MVISGLLHFGVVRKQLSKVSFEYTKLTTMILNNNSLQALSVNEISDLAKFVVIENFKHHSNNNVPNTYLKDVASVQKEERSYFKNAKSFVSKNRAGEIEGAIRVLRWNYKDQLPIQKIFGINPLEIAGTSPVKSIWHIGRFAIKKGCSDINLFKQLMTCAIAPICENKNSIAFAECDRKLLRVLKALGIGTIVIGDSINYLGSETIPVCFTYDGLINFFNKNKHLVASKELLNGTSFLNLPKRVVIDSEVSNYLLV